MMMRALLKKQLAELLSSFTARRSNGKKRRSGAGMIAIVAVVFLYVAVSFGFMVYNMALNMNLALAGTGYEWLTYTIYTGAAFTVGLIGSAFAAYSTLYNAKDNDLLLSMPIRPMYVLFARTFGLYLLTAVTEAIILVPLEIVQVICYGLSFGQILSFILTLVRLPRFTFVFSAFLGYLIALAAPKIRNMSIVSTVFLLAFLALYYVVIFRFENWIMQIAANAQSVSSAVKYAFFPFFALGKAWSGSFLWFLAFAALAVLLFFGVYALLSRSFIKLSTASKKTVRRVYTGRQQKAISPFEALLTKELSRLFTSSAYLINALGGILMLLLATVAQFIFRDRLLSLVNLSLGVYDLLPLFLPLAVSFIAGMCFVTAPSISLEGAYLPILRSFPVSERTILRAKLSTHMIVTAIPGMILHTVLCVSLLLGHRGLILAILFPFPIFWLSGVLGLIFNLLKPYLDWTNEAVAVKQSPSVLFCMLSFFGVIVLNGLLALALYTAGVAVPVVLACLIFFNTALALSLNVLLEKWGPKKFATL